MTDRDLIHAAMESTGLSARALSRVLDCDARTLLEAAKASTGLSLRALSHVLGVNERTARRWLAGDRAMPGPARQLCRALATDPSLVLALGATD